IEPHLDKAAGLDPVLSVDDHQLTGLEALVDDGGGLAQEADLDSALLHHAILADDEAERPLLTLLNDRRRHHDDVSPYVDLDPDVDELPGPQHLVAVVE